MGSVIDEKWMHFRITSLRNSSGGRASCAGEDPAPCECSGTAGRTGRLLSGLRAAVPVVHQRGEGFPAQERIDFRSVEDLPLQEGPRQPVEGVDMLEEQLFRPGH